MGRFINADGIIGANGDLAGYNQFAYCSNNPVVFADHSGYAQVHTMLSDGGGGSGALKLPYGGTVSLGKSVLVKNFGSSYDLYIGSEIKYYTHEQVCHLYESLIKDYIKPSSFISYAVGIVMALRISDKLPPDISNAINYSLLAWDTFKLISETKALEKINTIEAIKDKGNGMVAIPYSTYGAKGVWYHPWNGTPIFDLDFGTYPYINLPFKTKSLKISPLQF